MTEKSLKDTCEPLSIRQQNGLNEILHNLHCGKKSYYRGGDVLKKVLTRNKELVSGEDALLVSNTYGIESRQLAILFLSHGLDMDVESFAKLLEEQKQRSKNMRPC